MLLTCYAEHAFSIEHSEGHTCLTKEVWTEYGARGASINDQFQEPESHQINNMI